MEYYGLRCINSLIIFGIRKNCRISRIIPIHKQGDKTDCRNYRGISVLSTSYKIVSNILLARLSPYIDEIIGDYSFNPEPSVFSSAV
jgi:hypothetical protein